ncbi:IS200/IS605 family accessory protein TnpB-related protein [Cupriavidus necator]
MAPKGKADTAAQEWFDTVEQRVLVLPHPKGALFETCLALTLQCKNLYNTIHFAVRNVLTAYMWDGEAGCWRIKPELHAEQARAIACFNAVVESLNRDRQAKFAAAIAAGSERAEKAKLTLLPVLGDEVQNLYRTVLDITVLDNVARQRPDQHGNVIYRRLPAKAAQLVLARYRDAWSGYFDAQKVFAAGGAAAGAMTGAPKPPNYLAKADRFVLELPLTQIGSTLIGLGDREIPVDFEETLSLTSEQMAAWNEYRIGDEVSRAAAKRGYRGGKPQHLRIVPQGRGIKFEVVMRVSSRLPADSLLTRLMQSLGKVLERQGSRRNDALLKAVAGMNVPAAAGDRGLNNTLTLAFSTGHNAEVISGGRLDLILGRLDAEIDALKATLTTPEVRALQARKEALELAGETLSRRERIDLATGLKAIYTNPAYQTLRARRQRWLDDYFHKLSRGVVDLCAERGVQVIALGQNKGWKDGVEMGAQQNRRFGRAPLTRLIDMIRYKAQARGIVVVTTEESYTSKTSFVSNEPLKCREHEKPSKKKTKKKDVEASPQPRAAQADTLQAQSNAPMGRRLKDERNTFVNHRETGRLARVHADVNGAFNMLRKVLKDFAYHRGLSLNYRLSRVSPRLGLTAIYLATGRRRIGADSGTAGSSTRRNPRNFIPLATAAEL